MTAKTPKSTRPIESPRLSSDEIDDLLAANPELQTELDQLLERMQTPGSQQALEKALQSISTSPLAPRE